ncbi:MAG: hypothetical protein H6Q26_1771 [Bacteroidetes bacterium]|uniref:hypothetical protein n=1 Tax=[Flexibacter] sp. ATCC 35208 TaxID=1936242 RepID=UPI0009CC6659|nr:hypothetical protein [[Flexibacter] sp. ATCC 35208]MBP1651614.1 hypothetical protein [Bacteroidota bacterium]OMP76675.1 hypothetical protein BW716_23685 [[Flexibacter] sp. ATCC 35208]
MTESVITLAPADVKVLAQLRTRVDLVAAWHKDQIWVKGVADNAFRQLPALRTWKLDAVNRLFAPGALTPDETLPVLEWHPLTDFIPVSLPASGLPAFATTKQLVNLAPCTTTDESFAILTEMRTLETYVATAPQIRLRHLRFAASARGQVLVAGVPLPSVPGTSYTLKDRILMPAGYDFNPPVIRSLVAEKLEGSRTHFLLFHVNGQYEMIPDTSFVHVTRSAVRLTAETLTHVL